MVVSYGDLPSLWADFADALSGRTSAMVDPPVFTGNWPAFTVASIVVTSGGGILTVTVDAPGGSLDLECPLPPQTITGFRNVIADPKWRRTVVNSWTSPAVNNGESWVSDARGKIILEVWSGVGSLETRAEAYTLTINDQVRLDVQIVNSWIVLDPIPPFTPGFDPNTLTFDDPLLTAYDVAGILTVRGWTGLQFDVATPTAPDDQEDLATFFQFPGGAELAVPGPDITALNNLADALSRGPGLNGSAQTHRGRDLLTVSSGFVTLAPPTGTSEDMMHRLATAVRTWLGGSLALPTTGKKALIGLNRAILVKRK